MVTQAPAKSVSNFNDDVPEANSGCCFSIPCLRSSQTSNAESDWWRRNPTGDGVSKCETSDVKKHWFKRGLYKLREWSELIAGPKWKTFIRRLSRKRNNCYCGPGSCGSPNKGQAKFGYDPISYALNFDEGTRNDDDYDEGFGSRDFSARYASLPVSTKCSMDLGDVPPVFK